MKFKKLIYIEFQVFINELNVLPGTIEVSNDIRIIRKQSIGDLINYGRLKGKIANENYLLLAGKIVQIIDFIEGLYLDDKLNFSISIDVNVQYSGQSNFEFTLNQLLRIANLNIPLSISCFEGDILNEDVV